MDGEVVVAAGTQEVSNDRGVSASKPLIMTRSSALPAERAVFVREACAGDAALCVEVESLLANQSRADALGSDEGLGIRDLGLERR